jgi:hypothetical protein
MWGETGHLKVFNMAEKGGGGGGDQVRRVIAQKWNLKTKGTAFKTEMWFQITKERGKHE